MNILYLAHRIPFPPNKGDKLRAFRQIEHLSKRHRVWCACFVDTPSDRQFIKPLSCYCEELAAIPLNRVTAAFRGFTGLLAGRTVTESAYRDAAMERVVRNWASSVPFDVVVAFSSSMTRYAFEVPARRRVLDLCDLDSEKWLGYAAASHPPVRWLYAVEGRRLAARERDWLSTFDVSIVITEAEAEPIRTAAPPGKLHVVGNGVTLPDVPGCAHPSGAGKVRRESLAERNHEGDAARADSGHARRAAGFSPRGEPVPKAIAKSHGTLHEKDNGSGPVVGFVGTMDYRPNVDAVRWFTSACWPAIRAAHPNATFRIAGRSPTRSVRALARVPGVRVIGEVDDMLHEVRRFDVSVAPLRMAWGLQNKVLEAMAAAKPVVLSSRAARGIAAENDRDYVLADTAVEVIHAVVQLLGDPTERARLGASARRFVAANHCWEAQLQKLELIVTGVLARTTRVDAVPKPARTAKRQKPVGSGLPHQP